MDHLQSLRDHLVRNLRGGDAYETFTEILAGFEPDQRGVVPPHAERSAWQILEHLRLAQRDILDFSRNENGTYVKKKWPDDYWSVSPEPPDTGAWDHAMNAFLEDRATLEALVLDPDRNLFAAFPWGKGQTLLREALLAADHASYHLGQLVMLHRALGS
jgi:hypothetical protein